MSTETLTHPALTPCAKCGQVDHGQYGEYPCAVCGLPTTWDPPAPPDLGALLDEQLRMHRRRR